MAMIASPISETTAVVKKRVFLVDDHPLVREWLINLINRQPDLMICGEAEDAPRALSAVGVLKPDVAIVDLSLTTGSGLELIKDIRAHSPDVAVIVLSMYDEALYAERALRAGARGYVMKRETTKKVLAAIRRVLEGGVHDTLVTISRPSWQKSSWVVGPSRRVINLSSRCSATANWRYSVYWVRAVVRRRLPRCSG